MCKKEYLPKKDNILPSQPFRPEYSVQSSRPFFNNCQRVKKFLLYSGVNMHCLNGSTRQKTERDRAAVANNYGNGLK